MTKAALHELLVRQAYAQGFFPMPDPESDEILWFNPDPRTIIPLAGFHVSRSLARTLRRVPFVITVNQDFGGVMAGCADRPSTWITAEFFRVYGDLHRRGHAHSLEVWLQGELVGGVYGLAQGGVFHAESMFHRVTDASKVALYYLVARMQERAMTLLEAQFMTPHLASLGAIALPRDEYLRRLAAERHIKTSFG